MQVVVSKQSFGAAPPKASPRTPVILLAVATDDVDQYPSEQSRAIAAHTTPDALGRFARLRPRVVVIDWDCPEIDGRALCRVAARAIDAPVVMATIRLVQQVPEALKAGCQAILLKPFPRNLAAARLGRLRREASFPPAIQAMFPRGTNRTCRSVACPSCRAGSAVAFDHASQHETWYACLTCDHVWRGHRQQ
jgi:DNA-binding response OmpR family regulator